MLIVKSTLINDSGFACREVYDTENTEYIEPYSGGISMLVPLHHTHTEDDLSFLQRHFPEGHSIFEDFQSSFYYEMSKDSLPC